MSNPDRSKKIIEALQSRGANKACPRCGSLHFGVVGETHIPIHTAAQPDSSVVPTAIITCNNCGYLTQHALGALEIPLEDVARAG